MSGRRGKAKGTRAAGRKAPAVPVQARPGRVLAKYDAAQTTNENRKHWAMVDSLSADAAASPSIRRILRNRSRYETANNTYAEGIVTTLANDTVGTGARLQLLGENIPRKDAKFVEREFSAWADAIDLAEKLRTMRTARAVDGEAFGIFINNGSLPSRVKLDLRLVEAEMITSPAMGPIAPNSVDGIRFDVAGNPVEYDVLREHPGSGVGGFGDSYLVPATDMLHYFAPKRPGQRRGIPELTPALALFAMLRRYTLSVLAASELAADLAAMLYTDQPPEGEAENAIPFETQEIERRMLMTLPAGWKMEQFKPEQPVTGYGEFKKEIINEIARGLQVPFNVAAGNSASYNYASGRLDFQVYFKSIRVERMRIRAQALDRIFAKWLREATLTEGYLPKSINRVDTDWSHDWFWDGSEHVDPQKEANAQETKLANRTTTLAKEHGKQGDDWEEQLEQVARELAKVKELEAKYGISMSPAPAPAAAPAPAKPEEAEDDEDEPAVAEASRIVRDAAGRMVGIERPAPRRRNRK